MRSGVIGSRRWGRTFRLLPLVLLALLAACCERAREASASVSAADGVAQFLETHWRRPLPAQGAAPPDFSPQEAALDPASCGGCHPEQLRDWRGALHAGAMRPGVLGQLMNMQAQDREGHQSCIRCHAPLAEQAESLVAAIASPDEKTAAGLHQQGVVCAACHVRGGQRFGPARRDGSAPRPGDQLPHGGWVADAAFGDSRFCAACHQFDAGGFALNGKMLENTYEEWKASRYAGEGKPCQSCHMPERRHLWRGIHDPEMVRSGITIELMAPHVDADAVSAALTLRNTGTGHHFPSYVTPRVIVEMVQQDAAGRELAGSRREYVIARQVPLDLSREIADTRVPAGARAALDYRAAREAHATTLVYRVQVEPDAFYTGLYRSLVADGAGRGEALIRQALADSLASRYVLFEERRALPAAVK